MKVNLVSLLMVSGGITLIYCGVKGYDPRDVIRWSLGGKKPEVAYPLPTSDSHEGDDPNPDDDSWSEDLGELAPPFIPGV